jgi:hypothetical protein
MCGVHTEFCASLNLLGIGSLPSKSTPLLACVICQGQELLGARPVMIIGAGRNVRLPVLLFNVHTLPLGCSAGFLVMMERCYYVSWLRSQLWSFDDIGDCKFQCDPSRSCDIFILLNYYQISTCNGGG